MITPDRTMLRELSSSLFTRLSTLPIPLALRLILLRWAGVAVDRTAVVGRGCRFSNTNVVLGARAHIGRGSEFRGFALVEVTAGAVVPPRTVIDTRHPGGYDMPIRLPAERAVRDR